MLPFFAVNIAAALFDIRVSSFVAATFFGILPAEAYFIKCGINEHGVFDHHKMSVENHRFVFADSMQGVFPQRFDLFDNRASGCFISLDFLFSIFR